MDSILYNQKGEEVGKVAIPETLFGVKWNADLVHQVVTSLASTARAGTAHAKTRGEVSGGGKKPWQQKGTGRARHGSIRSPLWVGGGVAHGPRNDKNYDRKVNKKMKRQAFLSALSAKYRDGEVLFVNFFALPEIKTKEARVILGALAKVSDRAGLIKKSANAAYIITPQKERVIEKSFRNIGTVAVGEARNLNIVDLLQYKYLIVTNPEESFQKIMN